MDSNLKFYALIDGDFLPVSIYFVDETDGTASVASVNGKPTSRVSRFGNSRTMAPWVPVSHIFMLSAGVYEAVTMDQLRERCFVHSSTVTPLPVES